MKSFISAILFSLSIFATPLYADEKIGVLLMHGKWSSSLENSPIGGLASFLDYKGFLVLAPDMPWSRERGLDKSYEESMTEIDGFVMELQSQGATKIIVGGHSMGANSALGYASRYNGITGVLAIAPGHVPELSGFQNKMDNDWQRAKKMLAAGKAHEITEFKDVNQGRQTEMTIRADIYLSWYDPNGAAVIPHNVAALKKDTALMWIIGEDDRMFDRGKEYAFNNAPPHVNNTYVVVNGGHKSTPDEGKNEILHWLKGL